MIQFLLILLLVTSPSAWAAPKATPEPTPEIEPTTEVETKPFKDQGVYGSLLGDPGINLLGINYAYWMNSNLRLNVGVGTVIVANTVGAGINYYLTDAPINRFYVGAAVNVLFYRDDVWFNDDIIDNSNSVSIFYPGLKIGFEFGGQNGVFFDIHMNAFLFTGKYVDKAFFLDPLPSLALGFYF